MKRPLSIAVLPAGAILLAGFLVPTLLGAAHGPAARSMGSGSAMMARPALAMRPISGRPIRSAPVSSRRPRFGGTSRRANLAPGYFIGTPCFTNSSYSGSFFCSQFLSHNRSRFGLSTGFVPYYSYYSPDVVSDEEPPAPVVEQDSSLVNQVERLTDEVEMLREDQVAGDNMRPPAVAPQAKAEEKPVAAVFVYRDGHLLESQNYAIQGQTLWVFAGQTTRKIPLADLDLDVTKKLNDDRGIDLAPPESR